MSSEILTDAEHRMTRAVEAMERDFQGIRTGRASTAPHSKCDLRHRAAQSAADTAVRLESPWPRPCAAW